MRRRTNWPRAIADRVRLLDRTTLLRGSLVTLLALLMLTAWGLAIGTPTTANPSATTARLSSAADGLPWTASELVSAPRVAVPDDEPGIATHPGVATPSPAPSAVHVLVTLKFRQQAALDQLLQQLSDPSSPEYHHYLTAAEFTAAFSPTPAVYNAVVAYFQAHGAASIQTYPDRMALGLTLGAGGLASVFGTTLTTYAMDAGTYYAPVSTATLPAPLVAYVSDVQGLSDYSQYFMHTDLTPSSSTRTSASPQSVTPPPGGGGGPAGPCQSQGGRFNCTTVQGLSYPEPIPKYKGGGEAVPASDLQIPYDVRALQKVSGYQTPGETNNTIATILWSTSVVPFGNGAYCSGLSSSQIAWDFYAPDVSSYFNNTIPVGEPHSEAISMAETGYNYSYPAGSQGRSATCGNPIEPTNVENTLDVEMAGSLSPGATVYQVFGGAPSAAEVNAALDDILSPSRSEFSNVAGTDTATNLAGLGNVSVISNSWTYGYGPVRCCYHNVCGTCGYNGCLRNNTAWYDGLEMAQARGITVLASSGDSGNDTVCAPAAAGWNTFGVVAVGGTTLVLNPTTLARTTVTTGSNPYTICKGSTTLCGGELVWYNSTWLIGSVGGVVPVNFSEPRWQKDSPDANAVIKAAAGTGFLGRGIPDIAAIANNTMISVTVGGTFYNAGNFAASGPTYWNVQGTSFSSPVEAGVVNAMDYALQVTGRAHLGYIDPASCSFGNAQYNGTLKNAAFYDVTQGANQNYAAGAGYDLVTGWGPIDANGWYTAYTPVKFLKGYADSPFGNGWSESLSFTVPSGTSDVVLFWTVSDSVTPTVTLPSGLVTKYVYGTSSGLAVGALAAGTYKVTISANGGWVNTATIGVYTISNDAYYSLVFADASQAKTLTLAPGAIQYVGVEENGGAYPITSPSITTPNEKTPSQSGGETDYIGFQNTGTFSFQTSASSYGILAVGVYFPGGG